jgi:hypothetical protein
MPELKRAQDTRPQGARVSVLWVSIVVMALADCTETFDAGSQLPVDGRNPIVLLNDSASENWQGEYAALLASSGALTLAGIVVGTSPNAPNVEDNLASWQGMVAAAHAAKLRNIPDPIPSVGAALKRPTSGDIDATQGNGSAGALAIVEASGRLALPSRPLAVVTGGRLTDVADAYLIDPKVADRVVVVSSLGSLSSSGAGMGNPNGEMDPWADTIVTSRFRYVQISAFYEQANDVPSSRIAELPANAFGDWIATKQPDIWTLPQAADQVAVAAVAIPGFVVKVERVAPSAPVDGGTTVGPPLVDKPGAQGWLVRKVAGSVAAARFWQLLSDPATYSP